MRRHLRWLAVLSALSTGLGMWLLFKAHPTGGGLGNLIFIIPLFIEICLCPLPAVAAGGTALVAAARARHPDAIGAFVVLALFSVGVVYVGVLSLLFGHEPSTGVTDWILQHISRGVTDPLHNPRPMLVLNALDLLIPVAVFAYIGASERIRPALMTACALVAAASTSLLFLLGAG